MQLVCATILHNICASYSGNNFKFTQYSTDFLVNAFLLSQTFSVSHFILVLIFFDKVENEVKKGINNSFRLKNSRLQRKCVNNVLAFGQRLCSSSLKANIANPFARVVWNGRLNSKSLFLVRFRLVVVINNWKKSVCEE